MVYELKPPQQQKGKLEKPQDYEIKEDLSCVKCGYNLRGLPRRHRCPECGTPVQRSIGGHLLTSASSFWLKKVAYGLGLMLWSIAAVLLSTVLFCGTPKLSYVLDWASAALALVGVIYLTAPEPRIAPSEFPFSLRRFLRVAAVVRFVCAAILLASMFKMPAFLVIGASIIGGLVSVFLMWGVAYYLRSFARRMDDLVLERATGQVIWGFALSVSVMIIFGVLSGFVATMRAGGPVICISTVAIMSVLFFGGWFWILLFQYYSTVRWAAYESGVQEETLGGGELV